MDLWPSCFHGVPCALKTGTRPGRTLGKHFFICGKRPEEQCQFVQRVKAPSMRCPVHGDLVTVRFPAQGNMVHYRCKRGTCWCGVTHWREGEEGRDQDKENIPIPTNSHKLSHCSPDNSGYVTAEGEREEERNVEGDMEENVKSVKGEVEVEDVKSVEEEREDVRSAEEEEEKDNVKTVKEEGENVRSVEETEVVPNCEESRQDEEGDCVEREDGEGDYVEGEDSEGDFGEGEGGEGDCVEREGSEGDCVEGENSEGVYVEGENSDGDGGEWETERGDGSDQTSEGDTSGVDPAFESWRKWREETSREKREEEESNGVGGEGGVEEVAESEDYSASESGKTSGEDGGEDGGEESEEEEEESEGGGEEFSPGESSETSGEEVGEESGGEEGGEGEGDGVEKSDGGEEEGVVGNCVEAGYGSQEPSTSVSTDNAPGAPSEEREEETDRVVVVEESPSPQFKLGSQYRTLYRQLQQTETLLQTMAHRLPDGGERLRAQRTVIMEKIGQIKKVPPPDMDRHRTAAPGSADAKLFQKGIDLQTRLLTSGVVEQLHASLESCPSPDTLAPQPPGVGVSLFPHQRQALAWLMWREGQTPSGGILADEMGLGKTLSMISLILLNPSDLTHHKDGLVSNRATLVVCAPSLIHQWEAEISHKLQPNTLSVLIYHGARRTKCARNLATYDVVITTYDIIGSEGATALSNDEAGPRRRVATSTALFQVLWYRIILDEAHKIRNPKTAMSLGVTGLKKVHRWAVTGTPVQNKLMDMYSIIRFLELAPFDDIREWKRSIEKKSVIGMQRLSTMIKVLLLRRTKEDIAATHKLPDKIINTHTVTLSPEEQTVYDTLFFEARQVLVQYLAEQKSGEGVEAVASNSLTATNPPSAPLPPPPLSPAVKCCVDEILHSVRGGQGGVKRGAMLVLLLRLRQCCCHPALMVTGVQGMDMEEGLEEALDSLSLDHVSRPKELWTLPSVFREQHLSTKSCEVLREVKRIRSLDPPEKCIIVSQWVKLLDIIKFQLDSAGISYTRIDGRVPPKQRNVNMSHFNSPSPNPAVMLLSMLAGGEGLNLVGGNHLFMLDLHWNPAVELQATDRAHRVGQTRDVHVHRFVCRSTVEQRIQVLQGKKMELSASVLSGASQSKHHNSKLTLEDLKALFLVE